MQGGTPEFLTTRELADLLRIKERKVYDMAASGEVPCLRATGKLLFPRREILTWLAASRSGPEPAAALPAVIVGSHDPLLEWALRESGSGLAAFADGSLDGLSRLAAGEAAAAGLHLHEPEEQGGGGWNARSLAEALPDAPVVLIEFARRQRGLILAPELAGRVSGLGDLTGLSIVRRQGAAASQTLFEALSRAAGVDPLALRGPEQPARSEADLALAVSAGQADCAFGLEAMARQFRLGFVGVIEERYDLAVWRRAYFDPPFQRLMAFLRSERLATRAAEMGGYDLRDLGRVHLNGTGG